VSRLVYVREAHALDGVSPLVGAQSPLVEQPLHLGERRRVAGQCSADLDLGMEVLVDDVDDLAARAFGGWPDRLVIVGTNGRVLYQSAPGPWGFDLDELESALEVFLTAPQPREGGSGLPLNG
jgi:hypothetical protein